MRDAYDLLKEKEAHLARVRHEVDSLRMVAELLDGDTDVSELSQPPSGAVQDYPAADHGSEATGTDGALFSLSTAAPRSKFWDKLKR